MKLTTILSALVIAFVLSSCAGPSLGDRLVEEGNATKEQGQKWNRGQGLISEGERQKKKGRSMIEDGEKLIKKGERNVERGKTLKAAVEGAS